MIIFQIIGVILYLYLTWRGLRDDCKGQEIVSYSWLSLLGFFLGSRIGYGLENWGIWNEYWGDWLLFWQRPGNSLAGAYLGWFLVSLLISNIRNWKLWAVLEDGVLSLIILIGFMSIGKNWWWFAGELVLLILFLIVRSKYRSFFWYKSGKKGFAYFFVNFLLSVLLMLEAVVFKRNILNVVGYSVFGLISVAGLFILGDVLEPLMVNFRRK